MEDSNVRAGLFPQGRGATLNIWASSANNSDRGARHAAAICRPVPVLKIADYAFRLRSSSCGGRVGFNSPCGLWAFGLPEIEYAPTNLPMHYLLPHAYSVCYHMFRSDYDVKGNDTIDADGKDGKNVFKIEAIPQGFFGKTPALRLSWLAPSELLNPNQAKR
jgi:hypothetical protein